MVFGTANLAGLSFSLYELYAYLYLFISTFVLFSDSKDVKGETLLIEFMKQSVKQGNKTDLLSIEKNPLILENLPAASNFDIHYVSGILSSFKKDTGKLMQKTFDRNQKLCLKMSLTILLQPVHYY